MRAEDDLRLAWHAERNGRLGRRDALLTLAVAGAASSDSAWVEPVRKRLIATRPDHPFAAFRTLERALADPRVGARLRRLRDQFPPNRVRWLLQRAEVARSPFTGRRPSLACVLDDLLDAAIVRRSRRSRPDPLTGFLLAFAVLIEGVQRQSGPGSRAA